MIIAGLGFSSKAQTHDILDAVAAALAHYDCREADLARLASIEKKRGNAALLEAGRLLNVSVEFVAGAPLEEILGSTGSLGRLISRSDLSLEKTGLPSVSEAAALASVGQTGHLLGARINTGPVSCALAHKSNAEVGGEKT